MISDNVRRMLEEEEFNWEKCKSVHYCTTTRWHIGETYFKLTESISGESRLEILNPTPEQVIAATTALCEVIDQ